MRQCSCLAPLNARTSRGSADRPPTDWATLDASRPPEPVPARDPGLAMQLIDFELRGEFIPLDALLKASGLAHSGGEAKVLITSGKVEVDGQPELRRTAKVRAGQVVAMTGSRVRVRAQGVEPPPG